MTFLSIEDTGKVWPTQEIKASLLVTSSNIFDDINTIYDEIFLCHSNFSLNLLAAFMRDAKERTLAVAIWQTVKQRRIRFREALCDSILEIDHESQHSTLSVEWVKINTHFKHDLECVDFFKSHQLVFLPGRHFYWNHITAPITNYVRFALLKPAQEFNNGVNYLNNVLAGLIK